MNEDFLKDKLQTHETRLNKHGERLDKLEQKQSEFKAEIKNLCESLKNLTNTMRWFMGMLGGSFVGFFFYIVQHGLFR